jgi:hypothetical protein
MNKIGTKSLELSKEELKKKILDEKINIKDVYRN